MATGNKNIWVGILIFIVIFIVILIWMFGGDKMTSNFIKNIMFGNNPNMTCDAGEKMVGLNASGAVCTYDYGAYNSAEGITISLYPIICNIDNAGKIYYNNITFKHYGCNTTHWNALY